MNHALLISLAACLLVGNSFAQERIYRCGNEYTNTVPSAQTKGCKLMEGGNVTVVQGTRPHAAQQKPAAAAPQAASAPGQRVDAADQKSRDSDARQILELELKKAQARQEELLREYNNGEPEKQGSEARNYQKYLDRVAELKASLARNESDMAGIRRELGRLGVPAAAPGAK
ncbi:hypothetical protein [Rhodoferax ferrireducens]|nr:hypothetical protein [Rhodoferax ferrireducens]